MKNQDFTTAITVDATPDRAFADICRVSEWWGRKLDGKSAAAGDVFTIHFGEVWVKFTVTDVDAPARIEWHVTDCYLAWLQDKTEWRGTSMQWRIVPKGKQTEIRFTHVGLTPARECYNDCSVGWTDNIHKSLFKLITEGRGLPDQF